LLKGVTVGDCGPKNGLNNIDNGFLSFDSYRIPKGYMLDKIAQIDENGEYCSKIDEPEKRFGMFMNPLSFGRAFVASNSQIISTSALTIAIRYCSTRRQFSSPSRTEE